MAAPEGMPDYRQIYRRLKRFTRGVYVCRDTRDNSLCVLKVFKGTESGELGIDINAEVQQYAQFQHNRHLIQVIEVLPDFPAEGDQTVVLELCNGGPAGGLRDPIQKNGQWIPEAFVWHILSQTIDGLVELAVAGASHGDCHDDNVFFQFPAESQSNPRALIRPNLDFPEVRLADYDVGAHRGLDAGERLASDLIEFSTRFISMLQTDASLRGQSPYSDSLVFWLQRFSLGDNRSAGVPHMNEMLRQFYDALPSYINAAGEKKLPQWLAIYFDEVSQQLVDVDDDDASDWDSDTSSNGSGLDVLMPDLPDPEPESTTEGPEEMEFDLHGPTEDLITACETYYSLSQDNDYQFVFSSAQGPGPWVTARKLAWIGGVATRHARAKCDDFLNQGNAKEDFDLVVAHLDIANQCHARANTYSVQAIQTAMSEARDETERKPWQSIWSVMQGEHKTNPP